MGPVWLWTVFPLLYMVRASSSSCGLAHRRRFRYLLLGHVNLSGFRNNDYRPGYFILAAYISFFWLLYPICWGLSEGSNTISPTSEMVFYGILDLFSGPFFLLGFIFFLAGFDTQALSPTAFGNAERGVYDQLPQQQQQQPQQPAPQKGAQPDVTPAVGA